MTSFFQIPTQQFSKACYTFSSMEAPAPPQLTTRRIFATWWPLAASWALMGIETPALSAIVARLANPEVHLAAYGGIVFPLALIIESPIIMLLAASTALSKDWASFAYVRRYMMTASAILTGLHILIVFTPLYYLIAEGLLGAPPEIIEPARLGLMIMIPWTWSIAYRRFHQGVLIRFGRSRTVTTGTFIRLAADILVLGTGYLIGSIPGIVVATSAVAAGVLSEAIYVGIVVRPVLRGPLRAAPTVKPALNRVSFAAFYVPLALTSLLMLVVNPLSSAAVSRMPQALESLAVWSVVTGLVFLLRTLSVAYNEVVVALLDEPGASVRLRQFAARLGLGTTAFQLLVAATPLSMFWFFTVSGLRIELADMARIGVWISLPLPFLVAWQSWFQGKLLHARRTRPITEAVAIYLVVDILLLIAGVVWQRPPGLYVGLAALMIAMAIQTAWLWWRSRAIPDSSTGPSVSPRSP